MFERLKAAWRILRGDNPVELPIGSMRSLEEATFEHKKEIAGALRELSTHLDIRTTLNAPCTESPNDCHCICWHLGRDDCCYCDEEIPEENEEIRRH